ncbi:MAG TPA: EscU/YscU/HrcU family type III secretion system export apparatus switch protein [Candidatus Hydrogenedentes bacterium]|nr:EscU/YscU/HrcU family type III secretion system export apparatus switch protein [Candidatus Hydrogenedentota bacterium]HPG66271.1 EscU/YscU/HrcU family type III secretion system export apparatus switch protein [Candidatus Hydrogenedentota bacterium]
MTDDARQARSRAIALRYDAESDAAPRVVAKGAGLLAEQIIAIAREHGIHVHEDPDLVAVLAKLDLDTYIPEELYRAVAEVLAFVYRVNHRLGSGLAQNPGRTPPP